MKSSKVKPKRPDFYDFLAHEVRVGDAERAVIKAAQKWRTDIWNDDYARALIQAVDRLNKLRGSK